MTSILVIAKGLLRTVGGFDTDLHGPEDVDLWCRLALRCPQIGYVPTPCYRYYADIAGSLSKNRLRAHYSLMSMQKILRLAQVDCPEKADMYRRYARKCAFRLLVAWMAGRERVSETDVKAHLSVFPPSPVEALALKILSMLPVRVRGRAEGWIRDAHGTFHKVFSRLE